MTSKAKRLERLEKGRKRSVLAVTIKGSGIWTVNGVQYTEDEYRAKFGSEDVTVFVVSYDRPKEGREEWWENS